MSKPKTRKRSGGSVQKVKVKGVRRPLYDPKLGTANAAIARYGRFARHPLFRIFTKLIEVSASLQRMAGMEDNLPWGEKKGWLQQELEKIVGPKDSRRSVPIHTAAEKIRLAVGGNAIRITNALSDLQEMASRLNGLGEKATFAEVITAFFERETQLQKEALYVCECASSLWLTKQQKPSRAEVRKAAEENLGRHIADYKWKRLLKRLGLDVQLPTDRAKRQGGTLRR